MGSPTKLFRGGGEQEDPLMPALFALAQHPALQEIQRHLQAGEALFAFLDDIYILCEPDRVSILFELAREAPFRYAHIEINMGKTRVWNAAGVEPLGARAMGWVGDHSLPDERQGLVVLGAPFGSEGFIQQCLKQTREEHDKLLNRLKLVPS